VKIPTNTLLTLHLTVDPVEITPGTVFLHQNREVTAKHVHMSVSPKGDPTVHVVTVCGLRFALKHPVIAIL